MGAERRVRWRRRLKAGLGCVLEAEGGVGRRGRERRLRRLPLVVGYHRVVEDTGAAARDSLPAMLTSIRMLESHLDWLGRRFRFASLDAVAERLAGGGEFAEPVAAITFDDGYADVFERAFPLLRRKGVPAAIFVVSDLVGTPGSFLHDRLYRALAGWRASRRPPAPGLAERLAALGVPAREARRLIERRFSPSALAARWLRTVPRAQLLGRVGTLEPEAGSEVSPGGGAKPITWEMLATMAAAGFTIGSHTASHALLTREDPGTVEREVRSSRAELERNLRIEVRHFAYPDGRFDPEAVGQVAAAGYVSAYTTCRHRDPAYPLLSVPRRLLWENSCLDAEGEFSARIMSYCVDRPIDPPSWRCLREHGRRRRAPALPLDSPAGEAIRG